MRTTQQTLLGWAWATQSSEVDEDNRLDTREQWTILPGMVASAQDARTPGLLTWNADTHSMGHIRLRASQKPLAVGGNLVTNLLERAAQGEDIPEDEVRCVLESPGQLAAIATLLKECGELLIVLRDDIVAAPQEFRPSAPRSAPEILPDDDVQGGLAHE